ncbi:hypothetical protein HK100_012408 [Physocladia obscura]|uniref:Uncharacterized protein n=1 Tax=Physocladia obscura TaxID=109957 RepID=A0AAD5XD86_9FUNG|nr:hypothetical protein HK100_012408 [Physocladia obscura]
MLGSYSDNQVIALAINELVATREIDIKNLGRLNNKYFYFRNDEKGNAQIVDNNDAALRDSDRYYTIAADVIVFNKERSHVLMEFRCPHQESNCKLNVIDNSSFQYKGCLGTPGGFFHAHVDIDKNGSPDFFKLAKRQITEQGISQPGAGDKIEFIQAKFNNYRDIRWKYSCNYVPTVALQFAVILNDAPKRLWFKSKFPHVRGMEGNNCQKSYWIDIKIIKSVYSKWKATFDMMHDLKFSDEKFNEFVESANHFVIHEGTKTPLNKSKNANALLKDLREAERVVDYDKKGQDKYHYNDFAFDHICNVVEAYDFLNSNFDSSTAKNLTETTKSLILAMAEINKKDIRPWLKDLESGEMPFDIFLDNVRDILPENPSGSDDTSFLGLAFLSSVVQEVISTYPIIKLSLALISVGYKIATAKANFQKHIAVLATRFCNLVEDIEALQETPLEILKKAPRTKKLLLKRIDNLLNCLINAADLCIHAKTTTTVWTAMTNGPQKVKEALISLQEAEDLLFHVKMDAILAGVAKIEADENQNKVEVNEYQVNEVYSNLKKSRNSAFFEYGQVDNSDPIDAVTSNLIESVSQISIGVENSTSHLHIPVETILEEVDSPLIVDSTSRVDSTITDVNIATKIMFEVYQRAPEIKNSGHLNRKYNYFRYGSLVTEYNATLNDIGPASQKYYSLTTDTVVFNPSCSHVLLVFRCPHKRVDGLVGCEHNILETNMPFQYKGCLGTPGTFFDAAKDTNNDKSPNYVGFAQRQFTESLKPLGGKYSTDINLLSFIGPQFNNYRDIRWYTSKNYVPALALQFVTVLKNDISGDLVDLPALEKKLGRQGVCVPAYWVDLNIIKSIYTNHKDVFEIFDKTFDNETFKKFVQMPAHFVLDDDTCQPRNKLMSENELLKNLNEDQQIIEFSSEINYEPRDIAFDHVVNIMRAWSYLKSKNTPN